MTDIKKYLSKNDNRNIIILSEVDSTNTYAKKLAKQGASSGTLIISDIQTAGKGRLGRSFFSPKGTSIYMSIILRPDVSAEKINLLTPCAAVAAARAVDKICGTETKIKWVNDLYLNGKKFCGILTESSLNSKGRLDFAIIGIGLNVRTIKKVFPAELLDIATSIEDETDKKFSLEMIAAEIINELNILLPGFSKANFINEYRNRMCIIGCNVSVTTNGTERIGKAIGISDNAGLIVQYNDGSSDIVTSGEARIIKNNCKFDYSKI